MVAALVAGHGTAEAAAAGGVSVATLHRRMREPAFKAAVSEGRAAKWVPLATALRDAVPKALQTMIELLAERESPATRIKAACAVVDYATKLHDLVDTQPRMAALEAAVEEAQKLAPAYDPSKLTEEATAA